MNFIKNMLTERDNCTFDITRVMWALSVLTFLGLSVYAVLHGDKWNPVNYGNGLALVLAAGGAVVVAKAAKAETNDPAS